MAVLAYLGIFLVVPFLVNAQNDPFVKYHLKQGVALLIFEAIGWIVAIGIGYFPIVGWVIISAWRVVEIVLAILGILNVVHGKEKELPLIGIYARNFTF